MSAWRPIDTAPKGQHILYFPATYRTRHGAEQLDLPPMVTVAYHPVGFPRQPTHWMPIPRPPLNEEAP